MDVAETGVCMEENDSMDAGERMNSMVIREPPLETETLQESEDSGPSRYY